MSVAVIINPKSGGSPPDAARRRAELASDIFTSAGVRGDVFVTERRGHGRELAAAAIRSGARLIIAWGGDGTVNEVASAVARTPASLAIVSSGSGNGLARELAVDPRPERAIRDALAAPPRLIDAGEIDGRMFFSIAGIGFDAHVAACFDAEQSGRRGFATYARITARELTRYCCGTLVVSGVERRRVLLVTIANSAQFGNGARIAPGARLDDGWLNLVVFEERSRLATIRALPRLFLGGLERVPEVSTARIQHATVESDRPIRFHVDGEPVEGPARLTARVLPSVLRVAVR